MIELHDLILYKKNNSTSIDLRNQWEIAHKTLNIIDTINIISSKQLYCAVVKEIVSNFTICRYRQHWNLNSTRSCGHWMKLEFTAAVFFCRPS